MELTQAYLDYFTKVNLALQEQGKLFVKLENTEDEIFKPTKKYPSDAGWDCRARIPGTVTIAPGARAKIPLGFGINIPLHHTGDLRPRSGLTSDYGIMVGYGTIDTGYTGELAATVFNLGSEPFTIHPKDRIAQLVVLPIVKGTREEFVDLEFVNELVELERGANGHGSSGVK
jgi:dUTP pyrophosphatase